MSEVAEKVILITKVKYVEGYKLQIEFNDGTMKLVDFEAFLEKSRHPDIQKYLDINEFRKYSIIDGNLDWNDYELCFPNHDLYEGQI